MSVKNKFSFNSKDQYFECGGVSVMGFSDFYPAGHQSGIGIIMNGKRVATNGDIRFEPTPGQWQPVPKQLKREVVKIDGMEAVKTRLAFPDKNAHLKGFNISRSCGSRRNMFLVAVRLILCSLFWPFVSF